MKKKDYLFAYGSLRPSEDPPKSMTNPEKDSIDGDEIQFESRKHHVWAEVDFNNGNKKVRGYTMLVDTDEFPSLDKREAPQYRRIRIMTDNGHLAWTYNYDPRGINQKRGFSIKKIQN